MQNGKKKKKKLCADNDAFRLQTLRVVAFTPTDSMEKEKKKTKHAFIYKTWQTRLLRHKETK